MIAPSRPRPRRPDEDFVLHCIARRMEQPIPEWRFCPPRRFRFDFAWPGDKVAMEVDGGGFINGRHSRGAGMRSDCEKSALAAQLGWRVFRVMPEHVKSGQAAECAERILKCR